MISIYKNSHYFFIINNKYCIIINIYYKKIKINSISSIEIKSINVVVIIKKK